MQAWTRQGWSEVRGTDAKTGKRDGMVGHGASETEVELGLTFDNIYLWTRRGAERA